MNMMSICISLQNTGSHLELQSINLTDEETGPVKLASGRQLIIIS